MIQKEITIIDLPIFTLDDNVRCIPASLNPKNDKAFYSLDSLLSTFAAVGSMPIGLVININGIDSTIGYVSDIIITVAQERLIIKGTAKTAEDRFADQIVNVMPRFMIKHSERCTYTNEYVIQRNMYTTRNSINVLHTGAFIHFFGTNKYVNVPSLTPKVTFINSVNIKLEDGTYSVYTIPYDPSSLDYSNLPKLIGYVSVVSDTLLPIDYRLYSHLDLEIDRKPYILEGDSLVIGNNQFYLKSIGDQQ